MPVWELQILLDRLGYYLPHILYGVDGAHASQPKTAAGFDDLVSQPVGGVA